MNLQYGSSGNSFSVRLLVHGIGPSKSDLNWSDRTQPDLNDLNHTLTRHPKQATLFWLEPERVNPILTRNQADAIRLDIDMTWIIIYTKN